ncbi:MAG: signal peptide peptidase SppA [Spirochaetales bacterium]
MSDLHTNKNTPPVSTKKPLSKSAKQGLIVLLAVLSIALIAGVYQFSRKGIPDSFETMPTVDLRNTTANIENETSPLRQITVKKTDYIAVLYIEGVIEEKNATYDQEWLLETIHTLTYDTKNKAILLYINSPGGGVYESDEVYLALEDYKDITNQSIWAYMGPLAASGGYYIACAADTIYANRNTLTGSIGVIAGQSIDLTGLMETHGIKMTTITAGKNKNMMNINSPFTEEQQAIMQSIADQSYDQFTQIIADSRDMNISQVRELADGRIYTAQQALENDLLDSIDTFENTLKTMEMTLFNTHDINIIPYRPQTEKNLWNYFLEFKTSIMPSEFGIFDIIEKYIALPDSMQYPAYYYHQP